MIRLSPEQKQTLYFAHRAIKQHRSALIYENVGTGKSYIAIMLARILEKFHQTQIIILAPASLLLMWHHISRQADIQNIRFYSFQAASLGKLPFISSSNVLWLVDEAHMLKNASTRRYKAFYAASRRHYVCLITATPVTMHESDLIHLMELCGFRPSNATDDYINARWFAKAIMTSTYADPLKINTNIKIRRENICYQISEKEIEILKELHHLSWPVIFSDTPDTCPTDQFSHLIPLLLTRRFLSHPAALLFTLKRLLRYYSHSRTSHGKFYSRKQFMKFFGMESYQPFLPFFEPNTSFPVSMNLQNKIQLLNDTLPEIIHRLETELLTDNKTQELQQYLDNHSDQKVILFTQFADTALYLYRHLKHADISLLTSKTSSKNQISVPARSILEPFSPQFNNICTSNKPGVLICTDKLSHGHNLQMASTLIHIDQPFNPATIQQREGRLLRTGQPAEYISLINCQASTSSVYINNIQKHHNNTSSNRISLAREWSNPPIPDLMIYHILKNKYTDAYYLKNQSHQFVPIPESMVDQIASQSDIIRQQDCIHIASTIPNDAFFSIQRLRRQLKFLRFHPEWDNIQKILNLIEEYIRIRPDFAEILNSLKTKTTISKIRQQLSEICQIIPDSFHKLPFIEYFYSRKGSNIK